MSAIWGYLDLRDKSDPESIKNRISDCRAIMGDGYKNCVIDITREKIIGNGFFACGIQHFSGRAEKEQLPIADEVNGYLFSADIILNARKKLVEELKTTLALQYKQFMLEGIFDTDNLEEAADGTLAYIAWLIWKEKFVDHITGMFAIAIYDLQKSRFLLFADHMGTRCINYCCMDGEIFFSTLTRPIVDVMPQDARGINERFIAACEANATPELCVFPGETPFQNVYQVLRGSYIVAGKYKFEEIEYWNPLMDKHDKASNKDYREIFRSTFFECVADAIDTDKNVASTISSGLDSTSVSGIAAIELAKENRKLYGFTQVPVSDYVSEYDEHVIADETKGVRTVLSKYDNIEHCFDDYQGKSVFTEVDRITQMMEVPVKAMTNLIWIDDILSKAREKDCRVLLIGQFGNGTISFGNILGRVYQELLEGHFKEAKKQLAVFGMKHGVPRKVLLGAVINELLAKKAFDLGISKGFDESFDKLYVRQDLLKKHNIKAVYRERTKKTGYNFFTSRRQTDGFILDKTVAQGVSIYDTRLSLYYGVIIRDPTRDKRLAELLLCFPNKEFCDNGVERRLVREYLKDIVPDAIRLDSNHRGRQGADVAFRMKKYGTEKINTAFNEALWDYMNQQNVEKLFGGKKIDLSNGFDFARILALNSFLEENKKVV